MALIALILTTAAFTDCEHLERHIVIHGPDAAAFTAEQDVTLEVMTTGLEVERVELYKGRHLMGTANAPSYSYRWHVTHEDNGSHKWQAFAYDTDGLVWPSEVSLYEVAIAPRTLGRPSEGAEQRCAELGSGCMCSEPLNTDSLAENGDAANPGDSRPATECNGGNAWSKLDYLVPHAESGMPAGNQVDWVWRWDSPGGGPTLSGDTSIPAEAKRVCTRSYFRLSPNYIPAPTGPCDGGKFQEIAIGGGTSWDFQIGSGGGSSRFQLRIGLGDFENQQPDRTGSLDDADCLGQWCRVETCIGGDFAGGSGDVYVEAYVERVSDGKRMDWTRHNVSQSGDRPGNPFPNLDWSYIWIANAFRGAGDFFCPSAPAGSWREVSHGMVAWWNTDTPGTFIGPAYEVEGR